MKVKPVIGIKATLATKDSGYLSLSWSARNDDNLVGQLLLLHPDGLFDGDLVKRVHRVLDALRHDPGLVGFDPDLDRVVDHPLDSDHDT